MLLYDWLAYLLFFAKPELVKSYLRKPIIVKLFTSEIWFDGRIPALSAYVSGNFFYQKENLHNFTTPRVCPTKAIC